MRKFLFLLILTLLSFAGYSQTELYNRYSSHSDLIVKCVNNMKLDSLTQIEVTILEGTDEKSWNWVLNEFNIGAQPEGQMSIMFSMRDKHDPSKPAPIQNEVVDQANSCYLGVDFKSRTLYVFASLAGTPPDSLLKLLVAKMVSQH